jgi:hypothetical protein
MDETCPLCTGGKGGGRLATCAASSSLSLSRRARSSCAPATTSACRSACSARASAATTRACAHPHAHTQPPFQSGKPKPPFQSGKPKRGEDTQARARTRRAQRRGADIKRVLRIAAARGAPPRARLRAANKDCRARCAAPRAPVARAPSLRGGGTVGECVEGTGGRGGCKATHSSLRGRVVR